MVAIEQATFKPTGATVKTTLAQWAQDVGALNVKNFGATGDGATNDFAAIQACFDAAFGTYASPHGTTGASSNRPVYFPPGHYMVNDTLLLRYVQGGLIRGAGSDATIIEYNGSVPGNDPPWYSYANYVGGNCTCLIATNGMGYSKIQGFTLKMTGWIDGPAGSVYNTSTSSHTCCFNWDWENVTVAERLPQAQGNSVITWEDVHFRDATYGVIMGSEQSASQSDTGSLVGCQFTNLFQAITTCNGNCLSHEIRGCVFTNVHSLTRETAAVFIEAGSLPSIIGNTFNGNDRVYRNDGQTLGFICGAVCNDQHFTINSGFQSLIGCVHDNASTGQFNRQGPHPVVIDACHTENGTFQGAGGTHVRGGSTFGLGGVPSAGGGLREWTTGTPLTFSQLPSGGTYFAEGLEVNISDGSTSTWGASCAGSGANHVLIRWNGTGWTVVGK